MEQLCERWKSVIIGHARRRKFAKSQDRANEQEEGNRLSDVDDGSDLLVRQTMQENDRKDGETFDKIEVRDVFHGIKY